MPNFTFLKAVVSLSVFFLLSAGSVWAGGALHYANGTSDLGGGVLPPPGVYLENHTVLVNKNRLKDGSGDTVPVDFNADVFADAVRILYVTPYKFLGADYTVQGVVPFYHADVQISDFNVDTTTTDIGDIVFSPMLLAWHLSPELHMASAVDITAPTGTYDPHDPATQIMSKNHWTITPVFAISYLPNHWDFSAKFMYDFHTTNEEWFDPSTGQQADLDAGQEFHVDWAIGYAPAVTNRDLTIGIAGYNHWQTTDDEIEGSKVIDGKTEIHGIGPIVKYWPNHGDYSWTVKYFKEYGAKSVAAGDQVQLKLQYHF